GGAGGQDEGGRPVEAAGRGGQAAGGIAGGDVDRHRAADVPGVRAVGGVADRDRGVRLVERDRVAVRVGVAGGVVDRAAHRVAALAGDRGRPGAGGAGGQDEGGRPVEAAGSGGQAARGIAGGDVDRHRAGVVPAGPVGAVADRDRRI